MRKIYLFDFIGVHSGMHYYNESFKKMLESNNNLVEILSNYSVDGKKPFMSNCYICSKPLGIYRALEAYMRLLLLLWKDRNSFLVILAYGDLLDALFLTLSFFSNKIIVDVHEAYALRLEPTNFISRWLLWIYKTKVKAVIYHSERSKCILSTAGYSGFFFYVPHFKYCFDKVCDISKVGIDVKNSINSGKINILFFGNISYAKGIDLLIEAVNKLDVKNIDRINIVIAGKDADGVIATVFNNYPTAYHTIMRHITDDELIFLYSHTNYVVLPYRKTSQSGVLEMASYFRRPMLLSNIPYFKDILNQYPSFGRLFEPNSEALSVLLREIVIVGDCNRSYYESVDIENFLEVNAYEYFLLELDKYMFTD